MTILCSVARQYPHKLVYNCVEKCSPSSLVDSEQNKVCFYSWKFSKFRIHFSMYILVYILVYNLVYILVYILVHILVYIFVYILVHILVYIFYTFWYTFTLQSDLADMMEGIDLEDDEEVCNGDIEPDKNPENEHSDVRFYLLSFLNLDNIQKFSYSFHLFYHILYCYFYCAAINPIKSSQISIDKPGQLPQTSWKLLKQF